MLTSTLPHNKTNDTSINEDYLLLLVNNDGNFEISMMDIYKNFADEKIALEKLCAGSNDNIDKILHYIATNIQSKISKKTFRYCSNFTSSFQTIEVNISLFRIKILRDRNYALKGRHMKECNERFMQLKKAILSKFSLWFHVFDMDLAYTKASLIPNLVVYSHRISGFNEVSHKITGDLKINIISNFGYGKSSYFLARVEFKGVKILSLSTWINFRYASCDEVMRYSKNFGYSNPVLNANKIWYYEEFLNDFDWNKAILYARDLANTLAISQEQFIKKYVIDECENMIQGLQSFFEKSTFIFEYTNPNDIQQNGSSNYKVDLNGHKLIDFRTEKLIGALDFISTMKDYESIISTQKYQDRIFKLTGKIIPFSIETLKFEQKNLINANEIYDSFTIIHEVLVDKEEFYKNEKADLKSGFGEKYSEEYKKFEEEYEISKKRKSELAYNVRLHSNNVQKLEMYIGKYNLSVGLKQNP